MLHIWQFINHKPKQRSYYYNINKVQVRKMSFVALGILDAKQIFQFDSPMFENTEINYKWNVNIS